MLCSNVPSPQLGQEHASSDGVPTGGKQALEWRILEAKCFIEDWEWRLSILQRLLPLSECSGAGRSRLFCNSYIGSDLSCRDMAFLPL
ncbi:hypothetical protein RJ641_021626 [Dillenia turbinata]|uniref:Uncharacterized protein n=1 Tax=Dillenia turbinata TaxID=194707 RepID=A0AAN8UF59_9MAGN